MKNALITITGIALLSAALPAEAQRMGPGSTTPPTLTLEMLDGKNAGPILWQEPGVVPPTDLPDNAVYIGPSSWGCDGNYSESGWEPGWSEMFTPDFTSDYIQRRTYFFNEFGYNTLSGGSTPYYFSLNAYDFNGIRKVTVRIAERDVVSNRGGVIDDGPTEFVEVSENAAVASLHPIFNYPKKYLAYWEKRLTFDVPPGGRFQTDRNVDLQFGITHFGAAAQIFVDVEDRFGNVTTDSVYLADDRLCN